MPKQSYAPGTEEYILNAPQPKAPAIGYDTPKGQQPGVFDTIGRSVLPYAGAALTGPAAPYLGLKYLDEDLGITGKASDLFSAAQNLVYSPESKTQGEVPSKGVGVKSAQEAAISKYGGISPKKPSLGLGQAGQALSSSMGFSPSMGYAARRMRGLAKEEDKYRGDLQKFTRAWQKGQGNILKSQEEINKIQGELNLNKTEQAQILASEHEKVAQARQDASVIFQKNLIQEQQN